jgi:pimeloyl-ACP methyl ester carboxylesterase
MAQLADYVSGGNVPTCGHYIPEEQPEELLQQLNAFFSQQA